MLKDEKRRELDALVGKQNADALIKSMLSREKSAQRQGTSYKALDPVTLDDIGDLTDAIMQSLEDEQMTAKATDKAMYTKQSTDKAPGDKRPAEMDGEEMDDEEMVMEDEEGDGEESLLTDYEIGKIADAVAKRLSMSMDEMKSMMHSHDSDMPKRTKSDDDELASTMKAYTESQESFAAAMVDALEALDTRLKELGEAKSTFAPSATHKNVVVDKDGNMAGLSEVEQAAYRMWFQNQ
jgi:hypothetical protein